MTEPPRLGSNLHISDQLVCERHSEETGLAGTAHGSRTGWTPLSRSSTSLATAGWMTVIFRSLFSHSSSDSWVHWSPAPAPLSPALPLDQVLLEPHLWSFPVLHPPSGLRGLPSPLVDTREELQLCFWSASLCAFVEQCQHMSSA